MNDGRSIRKKVCDSAILIAFAAAMLAVCIVPALASATCIPPDPVNLANTTCCGVNYTWQAGSGWHLIAGGMGGEFYGYSYDRTGSAWQSDSAIATGLSNVGNYSAPTVFQKNGVWYLIAGEEDGEFYGYSYDRTGSAWQSDSAIATGLSNVGNYSAPTVFQKDGVWYLIAGEEDGEFYGYSYDRTGSAWQSDSAIATGLSNVGNYSAPTVFQKDGAWYIITGGMNTFYGYNWTGSAWQTDIAIATTPPDPGVGNYSAPTVFRKDGVWYLIAGGNDGGFYGYSYDRTGSAWQTDSEIASGLPGEGSRSTPTVFDMGGNVTDSYNVSINGSWHNGTINTSVYEIVGSGGWVNITVWAWNASGTGTLSAGCVSDNVWLAGPGGTFGLVGSVSTGSSGGGGTYPSGWFETPTPAVTATKAPTASTTRTTTDAPPGDKVTPRPTKQTTSLKTTTPTAEDTTAGTPANGAPGFTVVFVIAGMLAIAYAMMRRRE